MPEPAQQPSRVRLSTSDSCDQPFGCLKCATAGRDEHHQRLPKRYDLRHGQIAAIAWRAAASMRGQSLASTAEAGTRLVPIPTAIAPAAK